MTKENIKIVIEAFFAVNKRLRASYNSGQCIKYSHTDKYYEDILEVYNELKKKKYEKDYLISTYRLDDGWVQSYATRLSKNR